MARSSASRLTTEARMNSEISFCKILSDPGEGLVRGGRPLSAGPFMSPMSWQILNMN